MARDLQKLSDDELEAQASHLAHQIGGKQHALAALIVECSKGDEDACDARDSLLEEIKALQRRLNALVREGERRGLDEEEEGGDASGDIIDQLQDTAQSAGDFIGDLIEGSAKAAEDLLRGAAKGAQALVEASGTSGSSGVRRPGRGSSAGTAGGGQGEALRVRDNSPGLPDWAPWAGGGVVLGGLGALAVWWMRKG